MCICPELPALRPRTRIVILAHRIELLKPTNTAKLVKTMLGASATLMQSDLRCAPEPVGKRWVLFPSDDAQPLEQVADQVDELLIPDGTWGQARNIARRHPACAELTPVRLTNAAPSSYHLRRQGDHAGLCTLEAVAEALRIIEGAACADALLGAFSAWVERALLVRAGAHESRAFARGGKPPSDSVL